MKICLIIPPSPFLLDERVFVSLGVLKVAASLEQSGHGVDVMDLSGVKNFEDAVSDYDFTHPETTHYGITATSPQMPAACKIASRIPLTKRTILGGPHATLVHAAARKECGADVEGRARHALRHLIGEFDTVVAGDGEKAIHLALNTTGIIDADDPGNDLFLTHQAFAESPWPARHLIDIESYKYSIDGERALSIISQLGCPFKCNFCAGRNSPMLRRMRLRPPQDAVDEIVSLHETYGIKGCMFLDDELNVSKGMLEMMRLLKQHADQRGIEWRLRGFLKAELFTDEQAEAMYAAGFRELLIGFEAADPRILVNIQKNATLEDNTRCMEIARRHGLRVKALMSIGHPGESGASVLAIRDWLLQVRPADFDCTIITPYPGSPYYDSAVRIEPGVYRYASPKTGDALYMHDVNFTKEAQYYKGAPGEYVSHVWTDGLSPERLVELRNLVEQDVRSALGIPFNRTGSVLQYEHSMGAGGSFLPPYILRSSKK